MLVQARLRRTHGVAKLVCVVVALGCSAERVSPPDRTSSGEALARGATPSEGASLDTPAPFDVAAVIDRVHFAYRPAERAGVFATDHSTYSVRADTGGVTVVARHHPRRDDAVGPSPGAPQMVESAPLRLEVRAISRGDIAAPPPSPPRVDAEGGLVIARGAIEERYRNDDRGVEQSFALGRAPRGDGDLVVRMRASGLDFRGTTETGLHFVDRARGLGLRYGHGTFIDADGRRTAIPATYDGDVIALVVPDRVLDEARYPAVLDPILSPELELDEPVEGRAPHAQLGPDVARLGSGYVVVWSDNRRTPGDGDVYAARVDAAGTVLDPHGIVVSEATGSQHTPRVAGGEDGALVVWADDRARSFDDVYGARLAPDGSVLDPDGVPISTASQTQGTPDVAWNGTDYFVTWFDRRLAFSGDVFGAGVSAAGVVSPSVVICDEALAQSAPRIASNGADFFVVWQDERTTGSSRDVYGTRVSASFVVQDADGIPLTADTEYQLAPQVASVGTGYLVAWLDGRDTVSGNAVWGRRIDASGSVIGDAVSLVTGVGVADGTPALGSDGAQYLLVFSRWTGMDYDLHGARFDAAASGLDGEGFPIATAPDDQTTAAVAGGAGGFLVVHQDESNDARSSYDIVATRVTSDGSIPPPGPTVVARSANAQHSVAVASNGAGYLVVFSDARNGSDGDVYGARLGPNGEMLDPLGIPIATGPTFAAWPAVASNGDGYLVVWGESATQIGPADVLGRIVNADGTLGAAADIAVEAGYQRVPVVASAGTDYYVAWQDYVADDEDIQGTLVSASGAVTTPGGVVICGEVGDQYFARIASSGSSYYVIWEDRRAGFGSSTYGTAIDAAGGIVTPNGELIAESFGFLASDGDGFFVLWNVETGGALQIYGTVIDAAGSIRDPGGVALGAFPASVALGARLTSNGLGYLYLLVRAAGDDAELFGTRIHDGVAEAPAGYSMGIVTGGLVGLDVASGVDRRYLLAYSRYVPEVPFATTRARARLLELESTDGSRCGVGGECDSGHCVSGVCCESACAGACQACSIATGSSADGVCAPRPEGEACDDGSACTLVDACAAGACVGAGSPCAASTVCEETPPDGYACEACAAGSYAPSGGTTCVPCDAGTYSGEGAASCTPCDAGTSSGAGAGTCTPCDAGTFSSGGAASCTACEAGSASSAGASSCTPCDAGTAAAAGASSCEPCAAGTYAGAGAGSCASCAAGTSSGPRASSCSPCDAGSSSSAGAGTCSPCGPGTHAATGGASSCVECEAGTYSGSGAISCTPCDAGSSSSAGAGACTPCDAGTYAAADGSSCAPCAEDTYSSASGATSCTAWTICGVDEYEATPGSATADRSCARCSICADGTTEVSPCTATSDTVCEPDAPDAGADPDAGAGSSDDAGAGARDATVRPSDAALDASADGGDAEVDAGCTCRAAGGSPSRGTATWLGLAFVLGLAGRRRRAKALSEHARP